MRYATSAPLPAFLAEAITRAGAAIAESTADRVTQPASPAGVAALIDVAFSELAHHVRGTIGVPELATALEKSEQKRRAAPLDKDKEPEKYWTAVLELAALAASCRASAAAAGSIQRTCRCRSRSSSRTARPRGPPRSRKR